MIISDDIYMAAYLLSAGLGLTDTKVTPNRGGYKVEFVLSGKQEDETRAEFLSGQAVVNIKNYLYRLFELRNVMYSMKNDRKTKGGPNEELRSRRHQKIT